MDDSAQDFNKRELKKLHKEEVKSKEKKARVIKNILFLLGIVGVIAAIGYGIVKLSDPQASFTKPLSLEVEEIDHVKGNINGNVTLVEYGDYECPGCSAYAPIVSASAEMFDELKIVYRHFPLPGHKNTLPASYAAEAAAKQGKFWEMNDLLYASQQDWMPLSDPKAKFEEYATSLELNIDQFKQDYDSDEIKEKINRDLNSGNDSGVNATPTFFLNGRKIERLPSSAQQFFDIIQKEIDNKS